jgi:hypothetical protein
MSPDPNIPPHRPSPDFTARALETLRDDPEPTESEGLHLCPECDSTLVQPVEWREASAAFWELRLRCPNCSWENEGLYTRSQVDVFEEHLDDGLVQMLDDLERLSQVNMAAEIDRFVAALRCDLILPEDF